MRGQLDEFSASFGHTIVELVVSFNDKQAFKTTQGSAGSSSSPWLLLQGAGQVL